MPARLQISTEFVRDITESLVVGQDVSVRVLSVDATAGKFAVTMIPEGASAPPRQARSSGGYDPADATGERPQLKQQARAAKQQKPRDGGGASGARPHVKAGDTIKGRVASVAAFGVFIEVGGGFTGLLHESEMVAVEGGAPPPKEGDEMEATVVSVRGDKVALTQRSAAEVAQVGGWVLEGWEDRWWRGEGGVERRGPKMQLHVFKRLATLPPTFH